MLNFFYYKAKNIALPISSKLDLDQVNVLPNPMPKRLVVDQISYVSWTYKDIFNQLLAEFKS